MQKGHMMAGVSLLSTVKLCHIAPVLVHKLLFAPVCSEEQLTQGSAPLI